jgi:glutamate-1-semialdehyde 2,1-aminomutase
LEIIAEGKALKTLEARGEVLMMGISRILTDAGLPHHMLGVPAMFGFALCEKEPTDYRTWNEGDEPMYERIMMGLIHRGAVPDPDGREPWFLCTALSESDVEDTLNYFEDAVRDAKAG